MSESFIRQSAFAQTAVLVRASISIGINVIVNVDEQNVLPAYLPAYHFTAPEFFQCCDLLKAHRC
jgi:hypothetical protein